jgi:hypothetical protein
VQQRDTQTSFATDQTHTTLTFLKFLAEGSLDQP